MYVSSEICKSIIYNRNNRGLGHYPGEHHMRLFENKVNTVLFLPFAVYVRYDLNQ